LLAELAALNEEYARLQESDAAAMVNAKKRKRDDVKASAVKNQYRLWDRALALRIAIQKPLGSADCLPGHEARSAALQCTSDVEGAYDAASTACRGAITELLDVMNVLVTRNAPGDDGAGAGAGPHKRGRSDGSCIDSLWQDVEGARARFAPFRDAAVDRWHRKAMLATGRAAMRSQMHALNQSLSQQVAAQLRDPERALARTRRDAAAMSPVLCEHRGDTSPAPGEQGAGASAGVPGTYDDTAFYQVLLQEYLESAGVEGTAAAAMRVPKKRRVVDQRASKGRKIRYVALDKLVNFMVPQERHEQAKNVSALFSNLFGQGVRAREQ
jgi:protein AATF/BFR2